MDELNLNSIPARLNIATQILAAGFISNQVNMSNDKSFVAAKALSWADALINEHNKTGTTREMLHSDIEMLTNRVWELLKKTNGTKLVGDE